MGTTGRIREDGNEFAIEVFGLAYLVGEEVPFFLQRGVALKEVRDEVEKGGRRREV
jgi:hypothetical protein